MNCCLCLGRGYATGNLGTGTLLTTEGVFVPNVSAEWCCRTGHRWMKLIEEAALP